MEEYNSEALKTVEDIANNISMDIPDIHRNNEVLNELESKIANTYNENQMSVNSEHSVVNINSVRSELESEMCHSTLNDTKNESLMQNEELSTSSTNIESELEKIHGSTSDTIENIIYTKSVSDSVTDERMDWSESIPDSITSSDISVSKDVTNDNDLLNKDALSETVENTYTNTNLSSEKTVDDRIKITENLTSNDTIVEDCIIETTEKSNVLDSDLEKQTKESFNTPHNLDSEKQLGPSVSTQNLQESDIINTSDSEDLFSKDKDDTEEQSTGLAMLEDLSEIPSESFPDLEPNAKKLVSDSVVEINQSNFIKDSSEGEKLNISSEEKECSSNTQENEKSTEEEISNDTTAVSEEKNMEEKEAIAVETDSYQDKEISDKEMANSVRQYDKNKSVESSENTEFIQVCDNDKEDDGDKDASLSLKRVIELDPFEPINNEDREGADAELCIIPDTERVISQAEKDAASSIPPLRDIREASVSSQSNNLDASSDQISGSAVVVFKYKKDEMQICNKCNLKRKVKYTYCEKDEAPRYLCDDNCLNTFKRSQDDKVILNWEEGGLRVKKFTGVSKEPPSLSFIRKCAACNKETNDVDQNLTWEIMDFCNEFCLSKYQKDTGSHCSSCKGEVKSNSLGKYCVRFGNDIRQFCTSVCLEKYKKGLKVCSYCQQDMSGGDNGFLAPVGDKGQFKDFCSQMCMDKYDVMTNDSPPKVDAGTVCSVCKTEKPITIEFELNSVPNYICGDLCFIAFSFVNKISPGKCAMCRRHFPKSTLEKHTMYYDNVQHSFCSTSCENIYIIAHRKIVPCSWCKVKKYNFDMIRRYSKSGPVINMCSVNCLSLYRVSIDAVNSRQTSCSFCQKVTHPMYHLTMSDASIRNFCTYNCVLNFQNQYPKQQMLVNNREDYPVPTGLPMKNKKHSGAETSESLGEVASLPIIANVQSLASTNGSLVSSTTAPPSLTPINTRSTRSKSSAVSTTVMNSTPQVINSFSEMPFQVQIKQHFIVRPAPLPEQRNVGTMCYTRKINRGITAKPTMVDQEVQTDEREAKKILIPVPVPIYVPSPMHMYSTPTPVPVPIPIPVPVPIFIPTTRNSAAGIMKEIKKIQVKIPTDPYEAELLMMAELVAEEKKEDMTDSESDVDDTGGPEDSYSPEPVDASNTFGDDMLQMALKMATELDEPAVDLEGALTANTITAPQGGEAHHPQDENVDDPQPMHHHMMDRSPSARGRKRGMRQPRGGAKRGRRMSHHQVDMPMMQHHQVQQPPPPPEPAEKPDANMCLKYTFGVNAWKQWVTTKNAELEKSSRHVVQLFKTEILQLTADELNFSLCLFVKEVRKPNGAEYAPDTIYYLCLGIQQYLFENGRIDNIFCDFYYEKFTDCLDEVAKKFSVLYNDSHYIVTRVEEEHLWESKQLGAHSPHVLLSTLMFFNTKHFNLTSVDEHMQLSFSHIMKHWKRNPNQPGASKVPGSRNVLLRFYPPQSAIQNNARKKKVYEQQENEDNPLRCPVKLYEFYLSKCPESVKTRNDVFYLQPERSCVPDSPVWYSTMPLPREALEKMLHRVKMVKEINVALLTS